MRAAMSCTSIHENYQELVKESSPVKVGCCSRTGCCAGVSDVCEVVVALAEIDYPRAENPRKNRLLGKLVAQIDVHAKRVVGFNGPAHCHARLIAMPGSDPLSRTLCMLCPI